MKIRHTIKRLRREQRLVKKISQNLSLRLTADRKERIDYVRRSLEFIKLNIPRTRRYFREKAYFSRSNRRNRLVTLTNTARTASVEKQIRVYGYSCTGRLTKEYFEEMGRKEMGIYLSIPPTPENEKAPTSSS